MKKKNNYVNYHKLTRNNALAGLIVFIVMSVLLTAAMGVASSAFMSYIAETKFSGEYDAAEHMVYVYDNPGSMSRDEVYEFFDGTDRPYYIKDAGGNVIHSHGDIPDVNEELRLDIGFNEGLVLIADPGSFSIIREKGGTYSLDFSSVVREVIRNINLSEVDEEDAVININLDINRDVLNIPLWVRMPLNDGGSLFCKCEIAFTGGDFIVWSLFITTITAIVTIVSVILIINVIHGFVNGRLTFKALFTDAVTGGPNWAWFVFKGNQVLKKKKNSNRNYAVVSLKLVKYRYYCICHSLAEGEEILRKVSGILAGNVMKKEFCAHSSASSFAMLLKCKDEEKIKKRVSHIITQLEGVSSEHKFAFHAGIAIVDASKYTVPGKHGRVVIDIEKEYNDASAACDLLSGSDDSGISLLDDKLIKEQKWINIVNETQKSALDNEEFVIYYQPKYNPKDDRLSGAEALIRWQSPEYGFVTPGRIIPIFEKNGFITEIDHYMISHVARDQKRWLDAGYSCVPVSVNVSRAHFIEGDLAEQIRDMVDREGCPHEYIEIELTESAFFDDKKALLTTIKRLKEYGFAVSMDDFGSGYSSLNSLKDMPLDVLKLDAEFFRGEQEDGRGEIVVSEAIKLAKSLNMRTVAEGVEVKEQVDFLASQGCDMIQGYFYAKPMPGADYEERMKTGGCDRSAEE
ncbi:MAG: EAL domain-containing protein [Lachnospiraceae bacterium]|nr:EAL domain-containing protein [Lachnospiraceae bacterium]